MSFNVYFDESNKITKTDIFEFSYYGALSCDELVASQLNSIHNSQTELHFSQFNLKQLPTYVEYINKLIKLNFYFNIFIINSSEIFSVCNNIDISYDNIRPLLYIKIPERLVYGITRNLISKNSVEIYIDNNTEYTKYDLETKLKEQLNSQSIYRKLNYSVSKVNSLDSKNNIMLQLTDVLVGIISFIFEKKYMKPSGSLSEKRYNEIRSKLNEPDKKIFDSCYKCYTSQKGNKEYTCLVSSINHENYEHLKRIYDNNNILFFSSSSIEKSELLYILLKNKNFLKKMCDQTIFLWDKDSDSSEGIIQPKPIEYSQEINHENIAKYITDFMATKLDFDWKYKMDILEIYKNSNHELLSIKDYTKSLNLSKKLNKMVKRYLEELKIPIKNNLVPAKTASK